MGLPVAPRALCSAVSVSPAPTQQDLSSSIMAPYFSPGLGFPGQIVPGPSDIVLEKMPLLPAHLSQCPL